MSPPGPFGRALYLTGPTASGKTGVARRWPGGSARRCWRSIR